MADHHPQASSRHTDNETVCTDPTPKTANPKWSRDLKLAEAVGRGSIPAWHTFIDRYTPLFHSIIRHYVFTEEEIRTLYVLMLERLYKEKLASYKGRSALSTWLVLVARNLSLDFVRKNKGRWVTPRTVRKLSKEDRRVFELHFVDGLPLQQVREELGQENGRNPDYAEVVEALERIYRCVDRRVLRNLSCRSHTESIGLESSQLLEFLNHVRMQHAYETLKTSPEYLLIEKEARKQAERALGLIRQLSPEEQRLLKLRYQNGHTAKEIAKKLQVRDSRKIYKMFEGCMARLRKMLNESEILDRQLSNMEGRRTGKTRGGVS